MYQPKLNKEALLKGYLGNKVASGKKLGQVSGYLDGMKVLSAIAATQK